MYVIPPCMWNPVKELKGIDFRGIRNQSCRWNPVKELKAIIPPHVDQAEHVRWNPVKELKATNCRLKTFCLE